MITITKGIVQNKVVGSNKYVVSIPYLQQSSVKNNGVTESVLEATLAHTPGIINSYNEGDVVFIGFEQGQTGKPIILGKLLLDENDNRGFAQLSSLNVADRAILPEDTKIGDVDFKTISGDLERLQFEIDNTDTDFVRDVLYDGESVVDSSGVANIPHFVKDVQLNGTSVVSSDTGIAYLTNIVKTNESNDFEEPQTFRQQIKFQSSLTDVGTLLDANNSSGSFSFKSYNQNSVSEVFGYDYDSGIIHFESGGSEGYLKLPNVGTSSSSARLATTEDILHLYNHRITFTMQGTDYTDWKFIMDVLSSEPNAISDFNGLPYACYNQKNFYGIWNGSGTQALKFGICLSISYQIFGSRYGISFVLGNGMYSGGTPSFDQQLYSTITPVFVSDTVSTTYI